MLCHLCSFERVINLENGLTALLISDTHPVAHRTHRDSDMSLTDDVEDTCSEDFEGESDDDAGDGDDDDDVDGVIDTDVEEDGDRSRKSKDTKLVNTVYMIERKMVDVAALFNNTQTLKFLSNDPHKKESANGNASWNVNFFHCYNY